MPAGTRGERTGLRLPRDRQGMPAPLPRHGPPPDCGLPEALRGHDDSPEGPPVYAIVLGLILLCGVGFLAVRWTSGRPGIINVAIRFILAAAVGVFLGYAALWLCRIVVLAVLLGMAAFLLSLKKLFDLR